MPVLQPFGGHGNSCTPTLIGEAADLVDQVRMPWPTIQDEAAALPDGLRVDPFDDRVQSFPDLTAQIGVAEGGSHPKA